MCRADVTCRVCAAFTSRQVRLGPMGHIILWNRRLRCNQMDGGGTGTSIASAPPEFSPWHAGREAASTVMSSGSPPTGGGESFPGFGAAPSQTSPDRRAAVRCIPRSWQRVARVAREGLPIRSASTSPMTRRSGRRHCHRMRRSQRQALRRDPPGMPLPGGSSTRLPQSRGPRGVGRVPGLKTRLQVRSSAPPSPSAGRSLGWAAAICVSHSARCRSNALPAAPIEHRPGACQMARALAARGRRGRDPGSAMYRVNLGREAPRTTVRRCRRNGPRSHPGSGRACRQPAAPAAVARI